MSLIYRKTIEEKKGMRSCRQAKERIMGRTMTMTIVTNKTASCNRNEIKSCVNHEFYRAARIFNILTYLTVDRSSPLCIINSVVSPVSGAQARRQVPTLSPRKKNSFFRAKSLSGIVLPSILNGWSRQVVLSPKGTVEEEGGDRMPE